MDERNDQTDDILEIQSVLQEVISALRRLDADGRAKALQAVMAVFGDAQPTMPTRSGSQSTGPEPTPEPTLGSFSEDRSMSPKEFILSKRPNTDIERITCLAYYLTHYRGEKVFRTLDLSKLNTEAAQLKFSNAAWALGNATTKGFLIAVGKGQRQLGATGELFVQALPDRAAARAALAHAVPRRKSKRSRGKRSSSKKQN